MKHVLYLGPGGRQLWRRSRGGWEPAEGRPDGPTWVVTDFAEESLAELETPRLFGKDRAAYLARQLANRFPDTPYRSVLPQATASGGWLERLAPTRQILLGVGNADRLDDELRQLPVQVAGVWPISLLIGALCKHSHLPDDLLVVLPHDDALRIVFVKNRSPVLARLAPARNEIDAHAEEILRTQRYLENIRLLDRNAPPCPVLLFGNTSRYEGRLAASLELIAPPPPWDEQLPEDWRFPLFDLALRSPPGQVAPLPQRADFVAAQMRRAALVGVCLCILTSFWAASENIRHTMETLREIDRENALGQQIGEQAGILDSRLGAVGVAPDLIRRAMTLEEQEVATAPPLEQHLQFISGVIGCHPGLRLNSVEWRLLAASEAACTRSGSGQESPPGAAPTAPSPEPDNKTTVPGRKVELSMEIRLPDTTSPGDRARVMRVISEHLGKAGQVQIIRDPARDLQETPLRGEAGKETNRNQSWCVTLPGSTKLVPGADKP